MNPQMVVMSKWFEHLTLNVVLRMIAGKRCFNNVVNGGEAGRSTTSAIRKLMRLLAWATVASDVIPFLEWLDLKGHLSTMKLVSKELDSIKESWVEEHKAGLDSEASRRQDFIDVMLTKIKDASPFGYSRQTIIKATVLVCFFFLFYLYLHKAPS